MDRTTTASKRTANLERRFERFRLSEEVLALAYERLVPMVGRVPASLRRSPQTCLIAGQPRQVRRA